MLNQHINIFPHYSCSIMLKGLFTQIRKFCHHFPQVVPILCEFSSFCWTPKKIFWRMWVTKQIYFIHFWEDILAQVQWQWAKTGLLFLFNLYVSQALNETFNKQEKKWIVGTNQSWWEICFGKSTGEMVVYSCLNVFLLMSSEDNIHHTRANLLFLQGDTNYWHVKNDVSLT